MSTWRYCCLARGIGGAVLLAALLVNPSGGVSEVRPELPVYNAPQQVTPRARIGGTLRGSSREDPAVAALVPDHVGFTANNTRH